MTRDKFIEMIKMSIPKLYNDDLNNKDDYNFSYVMIGNKIKNILYPNSELKTRELIDTDKDDKGRDIRIYFSPYIISDKCLIGFNYDGLEPQSSIHIIPLEKWRK